MLHRRLPHRRIQLGMLQHSAHFVLYKKNYFFFVRKTKEQEEKRKRCPSANEWCMPRHRVPWLDVSCWRFSEPQWHVIRLSRPVIPRRPRTTELWSHESICIRKKRIFFAAPCGNEIFSRDSAKFFSLDKGSPCAFLSIFHPLSSCFSCFGQLKNAFLRKCYSTCLTELFSASKNFSALELNGRGEKICETRWNCFTRVTDKILHVKRSRCVAKCRLRELLCRGRCRHVPDISAHQTWDRAVLMTLCLRLNNIIIRLIINRADTWSLRDIGILFAFVRARNHLKHHAKVRTFRADTNPVFPHFSFMTFSSCWLSCCLDISHTVRKTFWAISGATLRSKHLYSACDLVSGLIIEWN